MLRVFAALAACLFFPHSAAGQSAPGPIRAVIASERLASVNEAPRYFLVLRVEVSKERSASFSGANGHAYVVSGKVGVSAGALKRNLGPGESLFIRSGEAATFQGEGLIIHFVLDTGTESGSHYSGGAKVSELYRTKEPIPRLESGPYEFSLTKVTSPPSVKPPLHHRSGAAIYYVLEGGGTLHVAGGSEPRKVGAVQYEPNGFIHTWESGAVPLVLLQANLSREGAPEIIFLR